MFNDYNVCPGFHFHISEDKSDSGDNMGLKVDASLVADEDKKAIVDEKSPNWGLQSMNVEFKRGGRDVDPFDDNRDDIQDTNKDRELVRAQLMLYADRVFSRQHRTRLYQLFVNGAEFRLLLWDRSGLLVTEARSYVETPEDTTVLLRILFRYSEMTAEERGMDPTAIRLDRDSCGWKQMEAVGVRMTHDVDSIPRVLAPGEIPANFPWPSTPLFPSPLFGDGKLCADPTGLCTAHYHSSDSHDVLPTLTHIRQFFAESLDDPDWPRYAITVQGKQYLVARPHFPSQDSQTAGMVGRGTRGYVALEWTSQRFVYLKDAWRPFYAGVDSEGATLTLLNSKGVDNVPTCVGYEDVGEQETEVSKYSPHVGRKMISKGSEAELTATVSSPRLAAERAIAGLPTRQRGGVGSARTGTDKGKGKMTGGLLVPATAPSGSAGAAGPSARSMPPPPDPTRTTVGPWIRGTKRTAADVRAEDAGEYGTACRHMVHHRVVVAEVCLDSTQFTCGQAWVSIVSDAVTGTFSRFGLLAVAVADHRSVFPATSARRCFGQVQSFAQRYQRRQHSHHSYPSYRRGEGWASDHTWGYSS